jgi:signal transduction histidine kinase
MKDAAGQPPAAVLERMRPLRISLEALADAVETRLSCDLAAAVAMALDGARVEITSGGVEVRTDLAAVRGLRVRIRDHELIAILRDLLRNATHIMAGDGGGQLLVAGRASLRTVTLEVADTGTGLPVRDANRLFERGFSTKPTGSGFGLYYARKVLARYGAEIAIANRGDTTGARVVLTLKRVGPRDAMAGGKAAS